jgi:hypothetical protein
MVSSKWNFFFNELDKGYCVSSLNCFLVALKHYGFGLESTLLNLYVVFCLWEPSLKLLVWKNRGMSLAFGWSTCMAVQTHLTCYLLFVYSLVNLYNNQCFNF